jgi:predicted Zn finger-like uncharacterized protein
MDIRCGSCNKLFRVADEKVTGKGIRFKCSRCGEVITVTRGDVPAAPAAAPEAPAAPRITVPSPAEPAAPQQRKQASEPPAQEFQPQEHQPPLPSTGMDDFDFSEPHAAGASVGPTEGSLGGEGFSFDAPTEEQRSEADAGGEISISEEEEKEAETAFQFPADIISEPVRKPVFASPAASEEADREAETGSLAGPSVEEQPVPELTIEEEPTPEPEPPKKAPAVEARQAVPPQVKAAAEEEDGIDLGQALSIPKTIEPEKAPVKPAPAKVLSKARAEMPDLDASRTAPPAENVHPLASGNVTGALAGLGCALPVVLLALFAFTLTARFVPFFAAFPRDHLLAVIGTGIVSLGVMTGIVIAIVQAQAGKKLFFLLNVLIGAGFGLAYGAGLNAVTALASGAGLDLGRIVMGALSGATVAFLLSLLIVVARRILFFTREESFAAELSGPQKAGIALSLVIVLIALYSEGTLVGSMERSAQDVVQQLQEAITPDGLSVTNAHGYVDEKTGDLVITGAVQNGLDKDKDAWYLEADVFDQHQKVLATIKMLNGVQLFDQRDLDILAKRGRNIDELKAGMILALQKGAIPAKGSLNFEMHLMAPPEGMASFYPALKKTTLREAVGSIPGMQ